MSFAVALLIICMQVCLSHHIRVWLRGSVPLSTGEAGVILENLIHEFSVSCISLC